jgi:hypothetical protein
VVKRCPSGMTCAEGFYGSGLKAKGKSGESRAKVRAALG